MYQEQQLVQVGTTLALNNLMRYEIGKRYVKNRFRSQSHSKRKRRRRRVRRLPYQGHRIGCPNFSLPQTDEVHFRRSGSISFADWEHSSCEFLWQARGTAAKKSLLPGSVGQICHLPFAVAHSITASTFILA